MSKELITVGRITAAHGIKGWIKVFSYTDPIEQIFEYMPWRLRKGGRTQSLEIEQGRRQGRGLVALPAGYRSRDEAMLLSGWEIQVDEDRLAELPEGEFYWYQLEGLQVVNTNGDLLGKVDHLVETGANDVLVVKPVAGSIDDLERLVPFVEGRVVKDVDLDGGGIVVDWDSDY